MKYEKLPLLAGRARGSKGGPWPPHARPAREEARRPMAEAGPPDRARAGGTPGGARGARGTDGGGKGDRSPAREPADRRRPGPTTPHDGGRGRGRAVPPTTRTRPRRSAGPWGADRAAPTGGGESPAGRPTRHPGAAPEAHHKRQRPERDTPPGDGPERAAAAAAADPTRGGEGPTDAPGGSPPDTAGPPGRSHARPVAGRWGPGGFHHRRIP